MLDEEVISQEFHNFVLSSLNTFEAIPYPAPFMCRQGDTLVLYWSRKVDGDLFLTLSDDKVYGVFSNPDEWQYWRFGRSAPGLLVMLQHFF